MQDIAYNVIGAVTGLLGILGLFPLVSKLVRLVAGLLPRAKYEQLEKVLVETKTMLQLAEEGALLSSSQTFPRHFRTQLINLRNRTEKVRDQTDAANTTIRKFEAVLRGLSKRINLLCKEVIELRGDIITSTAQARRDSEQQNCRRCGSVVCSSPGPDGTTDSTRQPVLPMYASSNPPTTVVINGQQQLTHSSNTNTTPGSRSATQDTTNSAPPSYHERGPEPPTTPDGGASPPVQPEFTDPYSALLLLCRVEKYLASHGYGRIPAAPPRRKRSATSRYVAKGSKRSQLRRLSGGSTLSSQDEAHASGDDGESGEWTAEPLQV